MPLPYIKKLAKKHHMSVSSAETKWEEAKKQADKQGKGDNYGYITSIFQSMMKEEHEVSTSTGFSDLFLESLLESKVPIKKAAHMVYHRDYVKTKNKPYRKYDKRKHKQPVSEGVRDYFRGAGRSLMDIHQAGKRESMNAEFDRAVASWFKSLTDFNEFRQSLEPSKLKRLESNKPAPVNEGVWDSVKTIGDRLNRISFAGSNKPHITDEERFYKLREDYQQRLKHIVDLINKYGPDHKPALSAAWKKLSPSARTILMNGIRTIQSQLATPPTKPQPVKHPTGYQHLPRGSEKRRRQRYG